MTLFFNLAFSTWYAFFTVNWPFKEGLHIRWSTTLFRLKGRLHMSFASIELKIWFIRLWIQSPEEGSINSWTLASWSSVFTGDCTEKDEGIDNHLWSQIFIDSPLPSLQNNHSLSNSIELYKLLQMNEGMHPIFAFNSCPSLKYLYFMIWTAKEFEFFNIRHSCLANRAMLIRIA